jgi:hypothetical protein
MVAENPERKGPEMRALPPVILAVLILLPPSIARADGPVETIHTMMAAVKAGDWEKAVDYIDIEGMCKFMKEEIARQTEHMSEEERKRLEETMGEEMRAMADPKKMKEKMIEALKEKPPEFTYRIKEVRDGKEGVKIVVVEITEKDKQPDTEEFPVKKVGGAWKITIPGME